MMHRVVALSIALVGCRAAPSLPPLPAAATEQPSTDVEATSLLGQPLSRPVLPEETRRRFEEALVEARQRSDADPGDADALIWLGRRTAYLGRYREALATNSRGIQRHRGDARFYRHRGHRYITLRDFDRAIADLERAASLVEGDDDEIEPDGLPNAKNTPTSTLQSNIWYHLGLAHYLKGDFTPALRAYQEAQKVSKNNDMRVATAYWHYMTLRRIGRPGDAMKILEPFAGKIEVIENEDYLKLIRLNRGELKPEVLLGQIKGDASTLGSASL